MNVIELLNAPGDLSDILIGFLITFVPWFVLRHTLIRKFLEKRKLYALLEIGALASYGILLIIAFLFILLISSIQIVFEYGAKMLFPLFLFWGGVIVFLVLLIRRLTK